MATATLSSLLTSWSLLLPPLAELAILPLTQAQFWAPGPQLCLGHGPSLWLHGDVGGGAAVSSHVEAASLVCLVTGGGGCRPSLPPPSLT